MTREHHQLVTRRTRPRKVLEQAFSISSLYKAFNYEEFKNFLTINFKVFNIRTFLHKTLFYAEFKNFLTINVKVFHVSKIECLDIVS